MSQAKPQSKPEQKKGPEQPKRSRPDHKLFPSSKDTPTNLYAWLEKMTIALTQRYGEAADFMKQRNPATGYPFYTIPTDVPLPTVQEPLAPANSAQPYGLRSSASTAIDTTIDRDPFSPLNDPHGFVKSRYLEAVKRSDASHDANIKARPMMFAYLVDDSRMSAESKTILERDHLAWQQINLSQDPVALITKIMQTHLTPDIEDQQTPLTDYHILSTYQALHQEPHEEINRFQKRFEQILQSYDTLHLPRPSVQHQVLHFLHRLDRTRYEDFRVQFLNQYTMGTVVIPDSIAEMAKKAQRHIPIAGSIPPAKTVFATASTQKAHKTAAKKASTGKKNDLFLPDIQWVFQRYTFSDSNIKTLFYHDFS